MCARRDDEDGAPAKWTHFAILLSHGLPRSSGRLAQIRVSGFSLLYHRYISSQLRQDAITRSRSHTVRPTSWSGHRPCPNKPYIHYVRSSSVCVGKCSVRRVLYTLSSTRNHGLTLNMSDKDQLFREGHCPKEGTRVLFKDQLYFRATCSDQVIR